MNGQSGADLTVGIVGMGYVGATTAASLVKRGVCVIGVESNDTKLALLRAGRSPVSEPLLEEALYAGAREGRFTATAELAEAVRASDVVMVAVGTPSGADGTVDLAALRRVVRQMARALQGSTRPCSVVIRSTVPPGTTRDLVAPALRAASPSVRVCHHPEFLREGTAMLDAEQPPMIVWGADARDAPAAEALMQRLYRGIAAPRIALGSVESELMKYACNVFHAVKIDFANEIGTVAAACGADPAAVMAALAQDRKLNISPAYLRPGFAFGGSCLPKDTRAMVAAARQHGLSVPLLESVLASNDEHLARQVQRILSHGRRPTLLLGLSFKPGTDDLRESPMVELAERLLGKGLPLTIHDPDLLPERLTGANAAYIREHLPHLHLLLRQDLDQALAAAEMVVVAKPCANLDPQALVGKAVVDLTRGPQPEVDCAMAQRRAA